MDRAKAKSMTRTVQTLAVALLGLTAVAAIVPLGAKAGPIEADPAALPPAPPPKPVEVAKVDVDVTTAAANLDSVSGPVKNQHVPEEEKPETTVAAPAPTGIDAWKYLGGIISDSYKRAIVVVNDQQHLLAEGQKFKPDPVNNPLAEVLIVEIDRTFIKVKEGETEHTITISPRQKAALNVLDPAAAARVAGANGGANPSYSAPANRGMATSTQLNPSAASRLRDLERMKMDAKARGDSKTAESLEGEINDAAKAARFEKGDKGQK